MPRRFQESLFTEEVDYVLKNNLSSLFHAVQGLRHSKMEEMCK